MAKKYIYTVKVEHRILAENDQHAIELAKKSQSLDAIFQVEKLKDVRPWWKRKPKVKKACSTCLYFHGSCGRYVMNPDLLKHPEECGYNEYFPHWENKNKEE